MNVLVVEDEPIVRDVLVRAASRAGHFVVAAVSNGQQAVEATSCFDPDIIVLDLALPLMDGFQVIDIIRASKSRARVLVFSAHCEENTVARAEKLHLAGFIDRDTARLSD